MTAATTSANVMPFMKEPSPAYLFGGRCGILYRPVRRALNQLRSARRG